MKYDGKELSKVLQNMFYKYFKDSKYTNSLEKIGHRINL